MQNTHASSENSGALYLMSAIAALAGLLFGYDTGVISGAILFIRKDFGLTDSMTGIVVSAVLFGALFGSALSGRATDVIGRKKVLVISAVTFVLGSIVSAMSPDPTWLIISRVILGLAIGVASFAAPLYLAEISPPAVRGKIVSLNQLAITIGILTSYIVDYLLAASGLWRWMLGAGVFPAFVLLVGLFFLPESPRWILGKGDEPRARGILRSIRSGGQVDTEIKEIQASLEKSTSDWRYLFSKWVRPAFLIALGLAFFQQTTGINTIIYYAPSILQMAGLEESQVAILATLGLGVVNVLATIASFPLVDRLGRRPLLLGGLVGMGLSLGLGGYAFQRQGELWASHVAIASMVLYIISFAVSLGPVCWLIIAEIFPLRIRGLGVSIASSGNWAANMGVSVTFLGLVNALGTSGTFWLYSGICVVAWFFVFFKVPETKGRSLEEIEASLRCSFPGEEFQVPSESSSVA